jgi:hypothetical protein
VAPGGERGSLVRGVGWLAGATLVAGALTHALESRPLVGILLGAIAADVARTRVEAYEPAGATPHGRAARAVRGAAVGLAVGLAPLLAGALSGLANVHLVAPSPLGLATGGARAIAVAYRDEVLGRGIPLALAARAGVPLPATLAWIALLAAAPAAATGASAAALAATLAGAMLFAVAWRRGGLAAGWGAHAAWLFAVGVVARGEPFELAWRSGALGPAGRAAGVAGWLAAASLGVAALALARAPRR